MIINDKRALAYIAEIKEILPIEGYDRVEIAVVGGWRVIVSKMDNFKPGDKCVYFEIDSLVPKEDARFAFLEKRKYVIKTLRMCKTISQGLVMPLSIYPEIDGAPVGTDVTDILGVKYYVPEDNQRKSNNPPVVMSSKRKELSKHWWYSSVMKCELGRKFIRWILKEEVPQGFPTKFEYIKRTDEERIENLPFLYGYKNPLIVTEKIDGTSATYIVERLKGKMKFKFYVCTRNRTIPVDDGSIYWRLANKYRIKELLELYLRTYPDINYVCLQGEAISTNIQSNPYKVKDDDLYIFNVIDSINGRYNSLDAKGLLQVMQIALYKELKNEVAKSDISIKFVPILDTNYYLPDNIDDIKKDATGKSVLNPDVYREGVVLRDPLEGLSFKNVSREYLLKKN